MSSNYAIVSCAHRANATAIGSAGHATGYSRAQIVGTSFHTIFFVFSI